jgi:predicted MFS family arabinose efflux permease
MSAHPLFTARFFIMFGYTFTVFTSLFQLLPVAPYRVLALGGSTAVAGLFHGFLTFSSALSGPVTGVMSDRLGHRPMLITVSIVLAAFTFSYAFITDYHLLLALVVVHGCAWSALLAASGAYMTATIPESRRAEGLSYWGLATVLAIGAAPAIGFWVYHFGWFALCLEIAALNLVMAAIAWSLPDDRDEAEALAHDRGEVANAPLTVRTFIRSHVEWRVFWLAITTALIAFGYGAITSFSALFADDLGVAPRSLFLSVMAITTVLGRVSVGRTLDAIGPRRVLIPCLIVPAVGLLLLGFAQGRLTIVLAALVFGAGFGLMHPAFTSYVIEHVPARRRGAAFGAMLAAFDTGIGLGASVLGVVIHAYGFRVAFVIAALFAAMSVPYFLFTERRLGLQPAPAGANRPSR